MEKITTRIIVMNRSFGYNRKKPVQLWTLKKHHANVMTGKQTVGCDCEHYILVMAEKEKLLGSLIVTRL